MTRVTVNWDRALMLSIAGQRRPWLTWCMKLLSVTGSGLVEFPFAILLLARLFFRGRKDRAGWYAASVLSGWALYGFSKLAVHRPRPHVISHLAHGAGWYSYPSGHSMLAPLVFGLGATAWFAPWRSDWTRNSAVALTILVALAIGVSRVYLGSHYPTDVFGGLLLGSSWSAFALEWWERRSARFDKDLQTIR
jgi:undecaprenyl-diphosphatase